MKINSSHPGKLDRILTQPNLNNAEYANRKFIKLAAIIVSLVPILKGFAQCAVRNYWKQKITGSPQLRIDTHPFRNSFIAALCS